MLNYTCFWQGSAGETDSIHAGLHASFQSLLPSDAPSSARLAYHCPVCWLWHTVCFATRRLIQFEYAVKKLNNQPGFIDLFWSGMLLVEQKSAGRDLARAKIQAFDYFSGLKTEALPRYVLVSDFQTFELLDLHTLNADVWPRAVVFSLSELPEFVEEFAFIRGDVAVFQRQQEAVNIRAAELMGRVHALLERDNYPTHDLQILLTCLVFCLFADSTHIFDADGTPLFRQLIENRSSPGGRDVGRLQMELFEVLNTPFEARQHALDAELARFPYINGALFEGTIRTPVFDVAMREALLAACAFDWQKVSPAIFGSLFQWKKYSAWHTGSFH